MKTYQHKIPSGSLREAYTFFNGPICREVMVRSSGESKGKRNSPKSQGESEWSIWRTWDLNYKEFPRLAVSSHFLPSGFLSLSHHLCLHFPQRKPHIGAWSHGSFCLFSSASEETGLGDVALVLGV